MNYPGKEELMQQADGLAIPELGLVSAQENRYTLEFIGVLLVALVVLPSCIVEA